MLRTFDKMHDDCNDAGHPCIYWGENGDWLTVVGQSRESEPLEQSNFQVAQRELKKVSPDCYRVESENHWAVGWVETLLVDPSNAKAVKVANGIKELLEDYPILDENHFSMLEWETASNYWESMSVADRVEVCQECSVSIFGARRTSFDDPNGTIQEYLLRN